MTRLLTIYDADYERTERRDEERRARAVRRSALLARYGSTEEGWAPCEREQLLQAAVAAWRVPQAHPFERWTESLDGQDISRNATAQVRKAVAEAYPLPTTFAEARAELDYWTQRRQNMLDLHDDETAEMLTDALDLVARVRAGMVRDLVMHELPTTTLADLHARFALLWASEISEPETEAALFRDLTSLVDNISTEPPPNAVPPAEHAPSRPEPHGHIADALRADPSRSDRDIARALGCSPTTVGKVRKDLGLAPSTHAAQQQGTAA